MIVNQTPYPISFESKMSQAIVCRYSEEGREYVFLPDIQDFTDCSALLQIVKPDNTFTENGVEIRTDEETGVTTLVIEIPQQATVVKGYGKYSICVYKEDMVIYSAEGPIWIDDNLITDEMIESVADVFGLRFPQDFFTVDQLPDVVAYVTAELISDDQTSDNTTWSSNKIDQEISGSVSGIIDDNETDEDTTWSSQKISDELTNVEVDDMTGATAGTAGIHGLVPAPAAGDEGKFLSGAGTWEDAGGLHVFSTNEQIIGTWIDGRPVYEKTFNIGTLSANNTNVIHNITNFERILSATGSGCMYNFGDTVPLFQYISSSMFSSISGANSTGFILYVSNDILTYYKYDVTMTVRYLKSA